jgi:enoyl-CoA hydratase/carnithine racemase
MARMLRAIDACPKPVVALAHGAAIGGGVGLVAAADIAIAAEGTVFSLAEVKLGILPAVISPYVLRAIGARNAREPVPHRREVRRARGAAGRARARGRPAGELEAAGAARSRRSCRRGPRPSAPRRRSSRR